ncbi:MAG TPA: hypothetical protein VHZ81_00665 [Galbitalea sp.]|jgi:hypothetical protein|nr:hypothetical protein [Galbitalea sp.]
MTQKSEPVRDRRAWGPARVVALAVASVMMAGGLSLASATAYAAFVAVPTAQGAHLKLSSDPNPVEFLDMSPGSVDHWQIDASLVDPSSTLTLAFSRNGDLITNPRGLRVEVDRCDQVWTNVSTTPVCGSGEANVIGPVAASAVSEATIFDLAGLTNVHDKFLLVTLSIPDSAAAEADTSLMGITGNIGFGLTASGDTPTSPGSPSSPGSPGSPGGPLAFTGVDILGLVLLALGALGLGVVLMGARKIRFANAGKASK